MIRCLILCMALLVGGCASVVPDWHARSMNLGNLPKDVIILQYPRGGDACWEKKAKDGTRYIDVRLFVHRRNIGRDYVTFTLNNGEEKSTKYPVDSATYKAKLATGFHRVIIRSGDFVASRSFRVYFCKAPGEF